MAKIGQRLGLTRYEADVYYKEALQLYDKHELEEARLKLEEAIALLPNNAEYHAARGFFFLEDGYKDRAAEDFEHALTLYPYETLAHYGLGVLAYREKQWDEALAHFLNAYRSRPDRPETLYYLAMTYHRLGKNEQAVEYMENARTLFERSGDRRRTDAGKWVREFNKLIERDPA